MTAGYGLNVRYIFTSTILFFCISMNLVLSNPRRYRQTNTLSVRFWPNGLIPYRLSENYTEGEKNKISVAMRRWERVTCIRFVPWTDELRIQLGETRYVNFYKGNTCFSRNGFSQYQPQTIGMGESCLRQMGTVIHEIGHAIGLRHTMERDDRSDYIDVFYDNVNPDSRNNYDTTSMRGYNYPLFNTPYDYKSIMHYGPTAWSSNGKPVMITKDPAYQSIIGTASHVSFYDAVYVNRAYQCREHCSRYITCLNGGEYGGNGEHGCHCICPEGFVGEQCETPVNGFQNNWNCGPDWEFAMGRCYKFFSSVYLSYSTATMLCNSNNGSLVSFTSASEVGWLSRRSEELLLLTTDKTFWVGVRRAAGNSTYVWQDGSLYNQNLMPLHELGTADQDGCGTTNGKAIVVESCDRKEENALICMKEFDPACGGRYRLTANSVLSIHSPGYPEAYLPSNCRYILQANTNMKIELDIEDFEMRSSRDCNDGFVLIQRTNDVTSGGTKYCGGTLHNQTITSEGNLLILTFKTTRRRTKRGFKATVRTLSGGRVPEPCDRPLRLLDLLIGRNERCDPITNPENQPSSSLLGIMWNLMGSFASSIVL